MRESGLPAQEPFEIPRSAGGNPAMIIIDLLALWIAASLGYACLMIIKPLKGRKRSKEDLGTTKSVRADSSIRARAVGSGA